MAEKERHPVEMTEIIMFDNDFAGLFYILWLCLVTIAYLYNCWVIPLRVTFPYQTEDNTRMWRIMDYSMDFLYFVDIIAIKPRVMYLEDGFWVRSPKLTRKNYLQKLQFKVRDFLHSVERLKIRFKKSYFNEFSVHRWMCCRCYRWTYYTSLTVL